jgi:hypothetical protein
MRDRKYIRHDDKAASRLAPEGRDGRFDLYVAANGLNDWVDLERPGRCILPKSEMSWQRLFGSVRLGGVAAGSRRLPN